MSRGYSAPQPLLPTHSCNGFASSEPELDAWLMRRAYANQLSGASRTFVVVDAQRAQGMKLGESLLQDGVKRCALVSQHAGMRALLVHALHERAKQFYEHYGFQVSPFHPLTLMLRLQQA
jgi:GNAT superfamily N-acetyltransferase